MYKFRNRKEAGILLAELLKKYKFDENVIVVALPRGGVPLAYEISKVISKPLDIFFVKKIPSPYNEEAGIGAVTESGLVWVNSEVVERLHIPNSYIEQKVAEKLEEIKAKRVVYGYNRLNISGKKVIIVDDGIATGSSMILASNALKKEGATDIIIAAPVAPTDIKELLKMSADEVYIIEYDPYFAAVGYYYDDFHQLSDEEVVSILTKTKEYR